MKTLVQCDFDGTITEDDASFFLLDLFAQGDWRQVLREYKEHRISVGEFNSRAFAMVKADKAALIEAARGIIPSCGTPVRGVKIRPGFQELVAYCSARNFRLVIVSNGLSFYIEAILEELGLADIEVHAAQAWFYPDGVRVGYRGPDGSQLDDGLKEAYIQLFLKQGYRVVYVGNGVSDIAAAKYAQLVLATGELLAYCKQNKIECQSFDDLSDVVKALEPL